MVTLAQGLPDGLAELLLELHCGLRHSFPIFSYKRVPAGQFLACPILSNTVRPLANTTSHRAVILASPHGQLYAVGIAFRLLA